MSCLTDCRHIVLAEWLVALHGAGIFLGILHLAFSTDPEIAPIYRRELASIDESLSRAWASIDRWFTGAIPTIGAIGDRLDDSVRRSSLAPYLLAALFFVAVLAFYEHALRQPPSLARVPEGCVDMGYHGHVICVPPATLGR